MGLLAPNAGKTTTLSGLVATACRDYGSESVLVASFTKTAAKELVSRQMPLNDEQVGTLHALCYRALGRPKLVDKALMKDWNAEHPTKGFGGMGTDVDDPYGCLESSGTKEGDLLLQDLNRLRGLRIDEESWPMRIQSFAQDWRDFKANTGTIDFTDLIEECVKQDVSIPHSAAALFLDEVQDFSPLELSLARQWGKSCEVLYLVGDDDQASLPGTQVMVEGGVTVPVEQLSPSLHRLVSYDLRGSSLSGLRRGSPFEIQPSAYAGVAHSITSAAGTTRTTHNHPWVIRWTEAANEKTVVYLMRKGHSFRVGWCQLLSSWGFCHLFTRARHEQADAAWILKVCDSRAEASLYESFISAQYGISTVLWNPIHDQSRGHYNADVIQRLFTMLGDHESRAVSCLNDFHRDIHFPFYERGKLNKGGAKSMQTAACNLIPGCMAVPNLMRIDKNGVEWHPIQSVDLAPYTGTVYGLSVPPNRTYVADSLITHNCLYQFKGCTAGAFLQPAIDPANLRVLAQSHRVPRAVHAAAVRWVEQITERMPKDYRPRDFEGCVETVGMTYQYPVSIQGQLEEWLARGKTVAFLASCSFFLDPLKHLLRDWGMPFHNPYRQRGDWNPLTGRSGTVSAGTRVTSYRKVARDAWWTYADLWQWAAVLEADPVFRRGAKTLIRRKAEEEATANVAVDPDDLEAWFQDEQAANAAGAGDLDWLQSHLLHAYEKPMRYACQIVERRGEAALQTTPQIILGTIHSVKGGEADVVVIYPDLSPAGYQEWTTPGDRQDSVRRCFYVGMTRAKEELHWAQPVGMSIGGYL